MVWQTSWLSGFIDGEGCFSASPRYCDSTSRCKLNASFSLKQDGESELLLHLYVLFGGGSLVQAPNKKTYIYKTSGEMPLHQIENYLGVHTLWTRKKWSFLLWSFLRKLLRSKGGKCSPSDFRSVKTMTTRLNKKVRPHSRKE